MNYNTSGDNSTHPTNIRLETPFDQVFRCFQLRQENITKDDSVGIYLAKNFESFINRLDNIFKMPKGDIPNNTDRMRRKMPEQGIQIIKSNVKPSLTSLKTECKRPKELLKENGTKTRHINEVTQENNSIHIVRDEEVEAFEPQNSKFIEIQKKSSGIDKNNRGRDNAHNMGKNNVDRHPFPPIMSLVGKNESFYTFPPPENATLAGHAGNSCQSKSDSDQLQ
uniref:Uncharacterized protein n=1 Tax=Glossina pallidipes TaxID=7398 RepID=A0A1A9ZRN7_GLOPL